MCARCRTHDLFLIGKSRGPQVACVPPVDPEGELLNHFLPQKCKLKPKNKFQTDEKQDKEVVDYLGLTIFDSNGWIFQNIHGNFLTKSFLLFTLQLNGKNEIEKVLFISFFEWMNF